MKVASLSFFGFCAVSLAADKASLAPALAQAAGFCGAFAGALVGRGRGWLKPPPNESAPVKAPVDTAAVSEDRPG